MGAVMAGRGRPSTKSVAAIDAQIAGLEALKRDLQIKEAERLFKLAQKAGLIAPELSDEQLEEALADVAARFSKSAPVQAASPRKTDKSIEIKAT